MKKRYHNIDFIKGICILIVIIEHSSWPDSIWLKGLFPFWDRIAVPCFMVISGFVNAKSIEGLTIKEAYEKTRIARKLKRFLVPYSFAFIIEIFAYWLFSRGFMSKLISNLEISDISAKLTISNVIKSFLTGGFGPGSYYTAVIFQFIFIFPLLFFFIKKHKFKGLVFSFFFCFLTELWQYYYSIPNSVYRILIFRHLLAICYGIYLSLGLFRNNKLLNCLSLISGFVYIFLHSYLRITPFFFRANWADVNFVACLFFMPIIEKLINNTELKNKKIESIGIASYHVYLTQMVYFNFAKKDFLIRIIKSQYLWCICNLLICVLVGLAFYQFDRYLQRLFNHSSS